MPPTDGRVTSTRGTDSATMMAARADVLPRVKKTAIPARQRPCNANEDAVTERRRDFDNVGFSSRLLDRRPGRNALQILRLCA